MMMNNNELADKLEEYNTWRRGDADVLHINPKELGEIIEQAAQALRGEEKAWEPDVGDEYYFIDDEGELVETTWLNDSVDRNHLASGNCYRLYLEAEIIAENRKTLVKLRKFGCKDGDWVFYYDECIKIDEISSNWGEPVRFATEELAEQALESVGEDKVKQLIEWGTV